MNTFVSYFVLYIYDIQLEIYILHIFVTPMHLITYVIVLSNLKIF